MNWIGDWWRGRDRRGPQTQATLSADQAAVLVRDLPLYRRFPRRHRETLHRLTAAFVGDKEFRGSGGVEVDEPMKVIIAAQACMMIVNLPRLGVYPQTREIIIYPGEFGETVDAVGPDGRVYRTRDMRVGEASRRGPILLAWDSVRHSTRFADGFNTVFHEFAHALDYLDGSANGAPPMDDADARERWRRVMSGEFDRFRAALASGRRILLDPYGAQDPAEFFAVATENFFERPRRLKRNHLALYREFRRFFGLDPYSW
jgi:hypothetical protein